MNPQLKDILINECRYTPKAFERYGVHCESMNLSAPLWGDKIYRTYDFSEHKDQRRKNPKGVQASLFGDLVSPEVILVEGEWDLFSAYEAGLENVVTGTNGAATFTNKMAEKLQGKTVYVVYDLDRAGRHGALGVAEKLSEYKCRLKIITLPEMGSEKADLRDYLTKFNGTKDSLLELINNSRWYQTEEDSGVDEIVKSAVKMSDVESREIDWLWHPYIPIGFPTNLIGDPGVGKSRLAANLAAALSNGIMAIDGQPIRSGSVLILSLEDPPSEVLKPRLEASNADMSRIFALEKAIIIDDQGKKVIRSLVKIHKPLLLIVDPIVSYMGGKVDSNRATEVREIYAFFQILAKEEKIAILIVRHVNKAKNEKAIHAGTGSIDFVAAVRSEIIFTEHPDDKNLRVMGHTKCNLAKKGDSLILRMTESGLDFVEKDERPIEKISKDFGHVDTETDDFSKIGMATKAVYECLSDGPMIRHDFDLDLATAGFSGKTLTRAIQSLDSVSHQRVSLIQSGRGPGVTVIGLKAHLQSLKDQKFGQVDQLKEYLQILSDQVSQKSSEKEAHHDLR